MLRRFALILLLAGSACGPKTLEQRQRHGEQLGDEATGQLDEAEKELRALEPDKAEDALREANETLSEPDIVHSPESDMLKSRLEELRAQLPTVREQRRLRDLDEKVRDRRSKIGPVLQAVRDDVEALSSKGLSEEKVKATREAMDDLKDLLEDTRELELRDEDFKSYVKRARSELDEAKNAVKVAEEKLRFVSGPIVRREEAAEKLKAAKGEKDPERRAQVLSEAISAYRACADEAGKFGKSLGEKTTIFVSGAATTPNAVETSCRTSESAANKQLQAAKKAAAAAAKKKPTGKKKKR